MKYGIYYAYWESEWGGDFLPYIKKVKKLGFDILEVACGDFTQKDIFLRRTRSIGSLLEVPILQVPHLPAIGNGIPD